VLETLESAKVQNWEKIELIVSDDCSTDDTVKLCAEWLELNKNRFVRTELLNVSRKTGVSANCNRCIRAARGEWIKLIAGDDILLPNCISDNMSYVAANEGSSIIFSQVLVFDNTFESKNFTEAIPVSYPMNLMDPAFSAEKQYKLLLLSDRITYTPSYFFKKQELLDIGLYDEENKLVEDYPMWLRLTQSGVKLFYFHKSTVGYRRHHLALNNTVDSGLFKPMLLKTASLKKAYVFPYLPWDISGSEKHILLISRFFQRAGINKKTQFFSAMYTLGTIYLNPFRYVIFFKKKILKLGRTNIFYAD
jgi:glycosyltransferase involved in cell wall biosynthesis